MYIHKQIAVDTTKCADYYKQHINYPQVKLSDMSQ